MAKNSGNREARLYLHFPCFDGVVSAVLTSEFLEGSLGFKISRYVPVNYDQARTWRSSQIDGKFAVVDFLYHPRAFFWADHHATSFQDPRDQVVVQSGSERHLYYDPNCPSCSLLLWQKLGSSLGDSPRLAEMVVWANKIDSAAYESVTEAILGGSPAMDISFSLAVEKDEDYCAFLVKSLRTKRLDEVAGLPEVREPAEFVKRQIRLGLDEMQDALHVDGDIVVGEMEQPRGGIVSRYSPYYFAPDARYSVMLMRSTDNAKITAMRNPWLDFESVEIGRIFEKFGGGGHKRVGSVLLQADRVAQASQILRQVVDTIRAQDNAKVAARTSFA